MKKVLFVASFLMNVLIMLVLSSKTTYKFPKYNLTVNPIDNMPLVTDDPFAALAYGGAPNEQRGEEFRKWLSTGLKISVRNASGSGTIVYFDSENGLAYVQSCGHLWSGNMSAQEGLSRKPTCNVIAWYHNQTKLSKPKTYPAEVLYYNNTRGQDVSLLRFKPDWEPEYLPIAPADFQFRENMRLHSVGCDGGREVAHYDVRYIGTRGGSYPDLVTTENSPRPGRSGGGLMTDEYYIGICWGTSEYDGSGNGFFTPLKIVREFNERNGFGWLNDATPLARLIPIIDRNLPQEQYPKDFIPIPRRF